MKYRLKVSELTSSHMSSYVETIKRAKNINDNRGYYHFAGLHGAPGNWCWHRQFSSKSPLNARMFLPWHRAYLHRLEQALQDINEEVAIPWWDWTIEAGIPPAFEQPQINGADNPIYNGEIRLSPPQIRPAVDRVTTRDPGPQLPVFSLPEADVNQDGRATLAESVDYLINKVTQFEIFNDLLEHIHDILHVYVGGDMNDTRYAAYDPIFYSHHCMIDRIWALWQQNHGVENYPASLHPVVLEPFGLTAKQVLNTEDLGYEYANSVSNIDISGTAIAG